MAVVDNPAWLRQVQTIPALCGRDWPLQVTYPAGSPAHHQPRAAGLVSSDAERSLPVHPVPRVPFNAAIRRMTDCP